MVRIPGSLFMHARLWIGAQNFVQICEVIKWIWMEPFTAPTVCRKWRLTAYVLTAA